MIRAFHTCIEMLKIHKIMEINCSLKTFEGDEKIMTILDMLNNKYENNKLMANAFEIIKDNYTNLVNDNYELVINEEGEVDVKIPSLEKKNEYVYKSISEYEYPLVMCMRISEIRKDDSYEYILSKFLALYKDKLEVFFKDVNSIDKLKLSIIKTKNNIDCVTYTSIVVMIIGAICLCIFSNMTSIVRCVLVIGIMAFLITALAMQFTKDGQVKNIIDGYISLIKTEWYEKELRKQYIFLCNFMG